MTIEDLCALIETAPVFQPGSVVWIRLARELDDGVLREIGRQLGEIGTKARVAFLATVGADASLEQAGHQTDEHELFEVFSELQRKPSVQDQVAELRRRYLIIRRGA